MTLRDHPRRYVTSTKSAESSGEVKTKRTRNDMAEAKRDHERVVYHDMIHNLRVAYIAGWGCIIVCKALLRCGQGSQELLILRVTI
jgi:hypothetical protein